MNDADPQRPRAEVDSTRSSGMPTRRTKLARVLLFLFSLVFFALLAAAFGEWFLSEKRDRIHRSDHLDPNLVQYDPELGWALSPGWEGAHSHHDFQARYKVDFRGFRADSDWIIKPHSKRIAIFGDSFVFGFGVNDDQTFVHLLDKSAGSGRAFINCGVPGYSNDQEMLYMERVLPRLRPDVVILVVYLANDLFDNQLPYPLQVRGAKPYFTLENQTLILHNSPAPTAQTSNQAQMTLSSMVFGERKNSLFGDFFAGSELFSVLQDSPAFRKDHSDEFSKRFVPAIDLFWAIANRARSLVEKQGVRFEIVILAGHSFVESPTSTSGQYQEALRAGILARQTSDVPIIDLATQMQRRFKQENQSWFFENDGHLNPLGHQVVTTLLEGQSLAESPR